MSDQPAVTAKQLLDTMEKVGDQPLGLGNAADLVGKSRTFDFSFEFMDFLFAVKASAKNRKTRMRYHANLGHIPFTSEDKNGRKNVMEIVNVAGAMLGGKVRITPEQRIMLAEEFWFDEPLTPNLLMARTVQLLLRSKPYLALLAESVRKPVQTPKFSSERDNVTSP